MRNLTLDLDALAVDSFSTAGDPSQWAAEPTTGTMTYAFSCVEAQNGGVADSFVCVRPQNGTVADTYVSCVYVEGLTLAYPCRTTR